MSTRGRAAILIIVVVVALALPRNHSAQTALPVADTRANPSQSLAIVVNRSNPINNLSFTELRKIFMGDRNHWPTGHRIAIVMLEYGQPERRAVLRLVYRMDEKTYQNFLLRGMFRGDVFV